ncbi:MAG: RNHCP domain-containing protein [Patescibacteria group bacterium]
MSFTRTIEDFTCAQCGLLVLGDGYTNHCTACLWSKHVDVEPGDRAATCGGMMKPIAGIRKGDLWVVRQKCEQCGHERENRLSARDSFGVLVML